MRDDPSIFRGHGQVPLPARMPPPSLGVQSPAPAPAPAHCPFSMPITTMPNQKSASPNRAVIDILVERFPMGFSNEANEVRPLNGSALFDIARTLNISDRDIETYRRALAYYQRRPAYLIAVAFGKKRRSIWGEKFANSTPPADRVAARDKLIRRNLWNDALEQIYRSRIGHLVDLPPLRATPRPSELTHNERKARWIERLQAAGFCDADIARIESGNLQTDDLAETRHALDVA